MLGDLLAVATEHGTVNGEPEARESLERAFAFANDRHADQRRKSGEEFIIHPLETAKVCAGLRLDIETLCAALLHDTVEDTSASLDEVREMFGEEIARLVDGVTTLWAGSHAPAYHWPPHRSRPARPVIAPQRR